LAAEHYHQAIKQPILERLKLGAYNNLGSLMKVNGDLSGAKAAYETCVAIAPEFALGHYNLGTTVRALGHLTDAIAHYQTAIHLNPGHAEAHQNLGVALLKLGRVEQSLASFGRAIALHSHHNPQQAEHLRRSLKEMGFQL
jgi:tetratricopeptide (TPR) repeat protein